MRPHGLRALAVFLATLCVIAVSVPAWAANKAIVVYVEGNDSEKARERILEAVPKTLDVVDPGKFDDALAKAGQKGDMGATVWVPKLREKSIKSVRKAVESVKAEGAIIARTRKGKGGKPELYILYVDPIPGDLAVDEAVSMKGTAADQTAAIKAVIEPPLSQIKGGEPAEEKPEKKEEPKEKEEAKPGPPEKDEAEEEDKPSDWKSNDFGRALFVIGLGIELGGRSFEYTDPITNNLRPYDVFGVPILAVEAEIYPGATTGTPVLEHIGLTVAYGHGFGLSSQTTDDPPLKFGTSWNRFAAGLRYRIPLGKNGAPVIGLSGRFGFVNFTFEPEGDTPEETAASDAIKKEVASVSYKYLRPGIDGRIPIGPVAILASFGYLGVIDAGDPERDVYPRFTSDNGPTTNPASDASIGAIDMGLGVGIRLVAGLEARLMAEYTRFFYAFEPNVGDEYVAGGALDQFFGIRAGAAYAY